jgi:hypothetical protein
VKGFLLGVFLTLVIGGFFFYIQRRYDTVDPCTAVESDLVAAVHASIQADVQAKTGSNVVGEVTAAVLKPVTNPVIAAEIKKQTGEENWFQCAFEVLELDFLGQKSGRVAEIRKRLSVP